MKATKKVTNIVVERYKYLCTGRALLRRTGRSVTYTDILVKNGFKATRAPTCTTSHIDRDIQLIVHGDDLVSVGDEHDLCWLQGVLSAR